MATRARTLLLLSLVAIPCAAFAHNGRDAGPMKAKPEAAEPAAGPVRIFDGIRVSVDPKTGVRSYVQVGDIPANNGRADARPMATDTLGPGVDYWVEKSFQGNGGGLPIVPAQYASTEPRVEMYDEGYYGDYGYGGYYPSYGYERGNRRDRRGGGRGDGGGGGPGRGDGHGDGHGGSTHGGPPVSMGTPRSPFGSWSPPPGPPGGGVGSQPRYFDGGVGAPVPMRYNSFRGRRG